MSPTKRIQLLHLGCLLGFVALCCESFWWHALPAWADIAAVGVLYFLLWLETHWVRQLFVDYGEKLTQRSHQAAKSMLMTRMLIAALSVVVIAASVGRL